MNEVLNSNVGPLKRLHIMTCKSIAAVLAGILLCGCEIPARYALEAFLADCARKNLRQAGAFMAPELRSALTNVPFAREAFVYGSKNLSWEVKDMIATGNGIVCLVNVHVAWTWMLPEHLHALLVCTMQKNSRDNRWYITAADVKIQEYVELVPETIPGHRYAWGGPYKPRWEIKQAVDEPLLPFVRRLDQYCKTWKH